MILEGAGRASEEVRCGARRGYEKGTREASLVHGIATRPLTIKLSSEAFASTALPCTQAAGHPYSSSAG